MVLYGISNCDTVRKARKFLQQKQVDFQFIDFRKDGLSIETVQAWLKQQPIEKIVNKRSTGWKQLSDEQKQQLMATEQLQLLVEIPTLIKRPVLQTESKVLFGFDAAEYETCI